MKPEALLLIPYLVIALVTWRRTFVVFTDRDNEARAGRRKGADRHYYYGEYIPDRQGRTTQAAALGGVWPGFLLYLAGRRS